MPKGKKFNAVEKHFMKKQVEYEKRIESDRNTIISLNKNVNDLIFDNLQLQNENVQLKDWVERLLNYTELDLNDVKSACEKDKEMARLAGMFNKFSGMLGGL